MTIGSIAAALLVVGALVLFNRPGSDGGEDAPYIARAHAQADGRAQGAADAPVTIIEFSDFQCPFCRTFATLTAEDLEQEFVEPGVVRLEYRHFAFLDERASGEESKQAAEAAECALDQGFFWEYHDILFQKQGAENAGVYSESNLRKYAAEMAAAWPERSFDQPAFESCLASGGKRAIVEADRLLGEASGVESTPTFFINGQRLLGAQPLAAFREAIESARSASGE